MDKAVVGPGIASSKGERRGTPDLGSGRTPRTTGIEAID